MQPVCVVEVSYEPILFAVGAVFNSKQISELLWGPSTPSSKCYTQALPKAPEPHYVSITVNTGWPFKDWTAAVEQGW